MTKLTSPSPSLLVRRIPAPHALTLLARLHRAGPRGGRRHRGRRPRAAGGCPRWPGPVRAPRGSATCRPPTVHHPRPDIDAITRRPDPCRGDLVGGCVGATVPVGVHHGHLPGPGGGAGRVCTRSTSGPATACRPLDDGSVEVDLDERGSTVRSGRGRPGHQPRATGGAPRPHRSRPGRRRRDSRRPDEHVVVVGGGLTAAQLVDTGRRSRWRLGDHGDPVGRWSSGTTTSTPAGMGPRHLRGFTATRPMPGRADPRHGTRSWWRASAGGRARPRLRDLAASRRIPDRRGRGGGGGAAALRSGTPWCVSADGNAGERRRVARGRRTSAVISAPPGTPRGAGPRGRTSSAPVAPGCSPCSSACASSVNPVPAVRLRSLMIGRLSLRGIRPFSPGPDVGHDPFDALARSNRLHALGGRPRRDPAALARAAQ